jgi:hypothetical protein
VPILTDVAWSVWLRQTEFNHGGQFPTNATFNANPHFGVQAMLTDNRFRWALLIGINLFCWYMLGFHQSASVAQTSPTNGELPFANSVVQRFDMIDQLKEINAQLKEQNALLRSGTVRVLVSLDPQSVGK